MTASPLDDIVSVYRAGYHCSEAMVVAVGGRYLHPVPDVLVRSSCPFGGGVCEHNELCGALSGGVMVLGALWGRNAAKVNDDFVKDLACKFRQRFLEHFGYTQCRPIHDSDWRTAESGCARVVCDAAEILTDLVETAHTQTPFVHEVQTP